MLKDQELDRLSISHGQVLWVIDGMNFVPWLNRPALDSVLKKFRLNKVPDFDRLGQVGRAGADFAYGFSEVMDCVLAMKLVSEGLAFRHVVGLMKFDPEKLRQYYRRAYLEANSGAGEPLLLRSGDGREVSFSGLAIDFMAQISKFGALSTPGPILLTPWQALERYTAHYANFHPMGLVRLSQLATEAVRLALVAPVVKRGRKS
jgi:hypothetical protein